MNKLPTSNTKYNASIQQIIHGKVVAYDIKSDGDTEYLLAVMVQSILEELGRLITKSS